MDCKVNYLTFHREEGAFKMNLVSKIALNMFATIKANREINNIFNIDLKTDKLQDWICSKMIMSMFLGALRDFQKHPNNSALFNKFFLFLLVNVF